MDIQSQYDQFQTTFEDLNKNKKYLNYGYSLKSKQTLEEKQEQLCKEIFQLANIKPGQKIVDVGFGSGEQDFLFADLYPHNHITGFNISKRQVDYANHRAELEKRSDKMIFYQGKAENMYQVEDSSIDRVLAIECAFYFDRPQFYGEAARVLKVGGLLILADICLGPGLKILDSDHTKYRNTGTLVTNRKKWEQFFITRLVRKINNHTKQGAQESVLQILKMLPKFNTDERRAWLQMAITSQLVALCLQFGLVQYHFIVLENFIK
jgi:ubiquinone/menaquinone biosynthesis C-methylase UbiE